HRPPRGLPFDARIAKQIPATLGQQRRIGGRRESVQALVQPPGAIDRRPAGAAAVRVLLDLLLLPGFELAVEIQIGQLVDGITSHIRSPNTARIFCVARNKQFLAASSVVPSTSPIVLSRMPW